MDSRKAVMQEVLLVTVGVLLCSAVMVGVYGLLGYFSLAVLFSALAGSFIIILNYFFLAVTVTLAADKAQQGKADEAKKLMRLSPIVRLAVMAIALFIGIKAGGTVIALVLPLVFLRPVLMLGEFFRKRGEQ